MRLWSIHPEYLDAKGLVALWREALLAKAVLEGKTKGYRKHPQLERFSNSKYPLRAINAYLRTVYAEALKRGYKFNGAKIARTAACAKMPVRAGQIDHEIKHLKAKLKIREPERASGLPGKPGAGLINPVFVRLSGGLERWEKFKSGRIK